MISLWVYFLLPLLLFLLDIRLLFKEQEDAEVFHIDAILLTATCSWFCTILFESSSIFLCKISFLLLQTHVYLFQLQKKIDANGRISQWEMFCKKSLLFCHVSIFCTMVDLFCTKRLFLQETAFFPDYFTRDKNGRNSFSKEFSCSCAINKFRTATLCRILNYSAEHFKMPGNYSISSYLLRIEKKRHFLKKQANTSKEYRRKICKSFTKTPTFAVHFVRVL